MATRTLFTIGYQQRSLEAFIEILQQAVIDVLVDVRDNPWSRKKGFSKKALAEALGDAGIEYVHAAFAGNPKPIRKGADDHGEILARYRAYLLANPDLFDELTALLSPYHEAGKSTCLMCYERHPGDCHRSILAEEWAAWRDEAVEIVHLAPHGAPRFIPPGAEEDQPDDTSLF